jgi:MFS family permease
MSRDAGLANAGSSAMNGRSSSGRNTLRGLCAGAVVSETGDWLLFIALPLYVLNVSGSPLATSTVFLAELVPAVLVGTICGPLIDRGHPGRLLACLTAAQALVVLPLIWAGPGRVWLVYVVAAVQASFTSLTTPAQQAIVPSIVAADETSRANAVIEMASSVARLVGSPLGGALLPVLGLRGLVLADIGSFVLSGAVFVALAMAIGRTRERSLSKPVGAFSAIAEGGRAIRGNVTLETAVVISFLAAVAQGLFLVLFVLFVLRTLHAGDQLVGLLRGVQAIGGVLGGVLVTVWLRKASARTLTVWGLAAFTLVSALCWNSPRLITAAWWYITLFIVVGIPATLLGTGLTTGTQQASRPHLRGRILSLLNVAQTLGQAAGILAAGTLSSIVSLAALLNVQAGCYLTCAVIAFTSFARHRPSSSERADELEVSAVSRCRESVVEL